jgi:hypothetical protein
MEVEGKGFKPIRRLKPKKKSLMLGLKGKKPSSLAWHKRWTGESSLAGEWSFAGLVGEAS